MGPRPPELANRRCPAQCRYIPGQEKPGRRSGPLQEHWTGPAGSGVSARPGSVRATVGVKKTFRSYMLANLTAHYVAATPVLYRLA